ncbi:MAG: S41 family peptidase [Spirochaetales bacterium]|nr:S41 family peptidase [Spirochaetales bacterium]
MKKIALILIVLALLVGTLFANGTPEDQKFFEELLRNTQTTNTTTGSSRTSPANSKGSEIISRDMATLERLYQYVEKNYLYDIDYDAVYEAMATALFDALGDKYSYYVPAEESDDYEEEVSGTYGGLGIYFSKTYVDYQDTEDESTLYAIISQVFPNTPSSKAGLKAGDYILEIGGESVVEMEATECAKKMKGEPGTSVELTIKRGDSVFKIDITRAIITVPTVEYAMIDGTTTAYLRILEFSQSTYRAITEAIDSLGKAGMEKLIIDLRDNPGGDVDVTLAIADLFISDSKLLSISYKDTSKNVTYVANNGVTVDPDVEVAILVNGGTASSAEIFSTAMKDNGRAVLFGTTTYGKGVMQVISSFGDGYTSITTASFVGPSGKTIHGEGVEPDYVIEEITVQDEELDAYTELLNSKAVETFVDKNPDFTDANIEKFAAEQAETGIREIVLLLVARNEYLSRMNYDDRPLADIVYDNVCKEAFEFLQSYENNGQSVTQNNTTTTRVVNF